MQIYLDCRVEIKVKEGLVNLDRDSCKNTGYSILLFHTTTIVKLVSIVGSSLFHWYTYIKCRTVDTLRLVLLIGKGTAKERGKRDC